MSQNQCLHDHRSGGSSLLFVHCFFHFTISPSSRKGPDTGLKFEVYRKDQHLYLEEKKKKRQHGSNQ